MFTLAIKQGGSKFEAGYRNRRNSSCCHAHMPDTVTRNSSTSRTRGEGVVGNTGVGGFPRLVRQTITIIVASAFLLLFPDSEKYAVKRRLIADCRAKRCRGGAAGSGGGAGRGMPLSNRLRNAVWSRQHA